MSSAFDVANYFLLLDDQSSGEGLSNLKLQKLCYYAQGFHAALFNAPLYPEEIYAWTHGPVTCDLYHYYKPYGKNPIPPTQMPFINLGRNQIDLLQEVFEVFGQYSAWKLRNMTHEEWPWMNHEADASLIPVHEMAEYFKSRLN